MLRRYTPTLHRLVRHLGFDVVRYDGRRYLNRKRIEVIRARKVNLVLDVGANLGQYALELRNDGYPGRIISFEPLTRAFTTLRERAADDANWECVQVALGSGDGEAELNVSENLWSSSLLRMAPAHEAAATSAAYVGTERVHVRTVDSLGIVQPDDRVYLKVDVQGFEARVLDGAPATLGNAEAVELELSFCELYDGQELVGDLLERMRREGFCLTMLGGATFREPESGELLSLDGIFVRRH